MESFQEKVNFIWEIADLLRGDYKQSDYGKVILPMTILRRLDCVLEATKDEVLAQHEELKEKELEDDAFILNRVTGCGFHNISEFDFKRLAGAQNDLVDNLKVYINSFSKNAYDIIRYFNFDEQIERLDRSNLLFLVMERFKSIDLHPDVVSNTEMGYIFEELIRKFSEQSNETAGEHFTPREVIKLMVNLLFEEDRDVLEKDGVIRTLYDPACGTGGMLSVAEEHLEELNSNASLRVFGQELNPESYAICKADMLLKGQNPANIKYGNSFTEDGLKEMEFNYMLSNPPFGVNWRKVSKFINNEHDEEGFDGRFGAGTPRVSDGSLLFLQHMISKMKEKERSKIGIVFNGSPLFTGGAGSGESEIRRWIIENDWLEAVVALPEELFYNTGIATYIWLLNNEKPEKREGKIQLINGVEFYEKMRKSLGNKRNRISDEQIKELTKIYRNFKEDKYCKIFANEKFGYQRICVEQPLRRSYRVNEETIEEFMETSGYSKIGDRSNGKKLQEELIKGLREKFEADKVYKSHDRFMEIIKDIFKEIDISLYVYIKKALFAAFGEQDDKAEPAKDKKGKLKPDSDLREYENVPLSEEIEEYFDREIKPHLEEAWIDDSKTKVGYEIPFTRYFYEYKELRSSVEIEEEINELEKEILKLLK